MLRDATLRTTSLFCLVSFLTSGCDLIAFETEPPPQRGDPCFYEGDVYVAEEVGLQYTCVGETWAVAPAPEHDMGSSTDLDMTDTPPADMDMEQLPVDMGGDMDAVEMGPADMAPEDMTPEDMPSEPRVLTSESVLSDERWTADDPPILDGLVRIPFGVTITIEAGTVIKASRRAALIVEKGGKLVAEGSRFAPIVFTSLSDGFTGIRRPGDWGGIVMLGEAPVHSEDTYDDTGVEEKYGGADATYDCGTLEFVRIEFAGARLDRRQSGLNGLSLMACGSDTKIDHVQIHRAAEDAFAIEGGTVDLRHVVASYFGEEGLEYNRGWVGTGQFIVLHTDGGGDRSFEGSNDTGNEPVSDPTIYNITISTERRDGLDGIKLNDRTFITLANGLFQGLDDYAIDVDHPRTAEFFTAGDSTIKHSLFFNVGGENGSGFPTQDEEDDGDDGDFDEPSFFTDVALGNIFGVDPGLDFTQDDENPHFRPSSTMLVSPFDPNAEDTSFESAPYYGAVNPGAQTPQDWLAGWTAFPLE